MKWVGRAPSNIALIKYVGKKDKTNRPISPSISYTLDHLFTVVQISPIQETQDRFAPLTQANYENILQTQSIQTMPINNFYPFTGSVVAISRFLKFFQFLKRTLKIPGFYLIQSGNSFPASIGAASSASSFATLTQVSYQIAKDLATTNQRFSIKDLSAISRQGSGSSCRSFFSPWALWENHYAESIAVPYSKLIHQLVIVSHKNKNVSSSMAHERVRTSPLFKDRDQRAKQRLKKLLSALKNKNWKECFQIGWDEFQDLHQMYESATPPIYYKEKASEEVIQIVKKIWQEKQDGPLITMDAGASVHLLYRPDQSKLAKTLYDTLSLKFNVLG